MDSLQNVGYAQRTNDWYASAACLNGTLYVLIIHGLNRPMAESGQDNEPTVVTETAAELDA